MSAYDTDIHEQNGRRYRVEFHVDDAMRAPWKEQDFGVVSEWTSREKAPGERVLNEDHGQFRYYDVAATTELARKDGWVGEGGRREGETVRQCVARAVEDNFEFLRAWCNDDWRYVGVVVTLLDDDGDETKHEASLWGVETWKDYHHEVIKQLADQIEHELHEHETLHIRVDPDPDVNWQNDAIQFPRLLAELWHVGGLTGEQLKDVMTETDLKAGEVEAIFARAVRTWEDIKAKTKTTTK